MNAAALDLSSHRAYVDFKTAVATLPVVLQSRRDELLKEWGLAPTTASDGSCLWAILAAPDESTAWTEPLGQMVASLNTGFRAPGEG